MYVCQQIWPSTEHERSYFLGAIFVTCYTLPLLLICICYAFILRRVWNRDAPGISSSSKVIYQSKVKVLKMLVVVVILFTFSWLPLYAIQLRHYFGSPLQHTDMEFYVLFQIALPIAQWLGSSNSCVNPIIYCFFSAKFRRGFREFIHCCKRSHNHDFNGVGREQWFQNGRTSSMYRSVNGGQESHTMYTSVRQPHQHKQYHYRAKRMAPNNNLQNNLQTNLQHNLQRDSNVISNHTTCF